MERQQNAVDQPFQRFYSTFEGLLSKLSAPLAFAGLPLRFDETALPETQNDKAENLEEAIAEPDVKKSSKAALRAVKEESGGYGFEARKLLRRADNRRYNFVCRHTHVRSAQDWKTTIMLMSLLMLERRLPRPV
jgi:hypothetical protein